MINHNVHNSSNAGYSLVEVLVAISVLLLATVGPMTIAARSLQYAEFSAQQNTAFLLAQEGIEAAYKARADQGLQHFDNPTSNDSWGWADIGAFSNCRSGGCGIDWTDADISAGVQDCSSDQSACRIYYNQFAGRAHYSHNSAGVATPFTRVITFTNISGENVVQVRSEVTWQSRGTGDERSVVLETYLHDIYDTSN